MMKAQTRQNLQSQACSIGHCKANLCTTEEGRKCKWRKVRDVPLSGMFGPLSRMSGRLSGMFGPLVWDVWPLVRDVWALLRDV
eukprot:6456966-Amphidinium_carterae.1